MRTILSLLACLVVLFCGTAWADISQVSFYPPGLTQPQYLLFQGNAGTAALDIDVYLGCEFYGLCSNSIQGIGNTHGVPITAGTWTMTAPGPAMTMTWVSDAVWAVTTHQPVVFSYDSIPPGWTLTGTVDFTDFGFLGAVGIFDHNLNTFQTTGGTLQPFFGNWGYIDMSVAFPVGTSKEALTLIAQSGGSLVAELSTGEINPTPEPGSVVMIGTALLVAGAFLRRLRP